MLEMLEDENWSCAFRACGENDKETSWACLDVRPPEEAVPGSGVSLAPITRADIVRVLFADDGENDASDWLGLFEVKDGRFLKLSAGCDYTGWD